MRDHLLSLVDERVPGLLARDVHLEEGGVVDELLEVADRARSRALGELGLGPVELRQQPRGAFLGDLALGAELVDQVADGLERGLGRVEDLDLLDADPEVPGRVS